MPDQSRSRRESIHDDFVSQVFRRTPRLAGSGGERSEQAVPRHRRRWARFDGPAGTQMVDTAISAMADWAASGNNANSGGTFAAADACDALLEATRRTAAELFGADPDALVFGANMTTITMAFTRAVGETLGPGDRVVGTRLDHDADVTSWRIACDRAGAEHVLAPFDPGTGLLDPQAVIDLIDERTRWVAVTGASNLIGSLVDLPPIVAAAQPVARGCTSTRCTWRRTGRSTSARSDATRSSHRRTSGTAHTRPCSARRPATGRAPRRQGAPSRRRGAATMGDRNAELRSDCVARRRRPVPARRDRGGDRSGRSRGVRGPARRVGGDPRRAPVGAADHGRPRADRGVHRRWHPFRRRGRRARGRRIATWSGHSYAVEVVDQLGLAGSGGVVRAGVVAYITDDDVARLLDSIQRIVLRPAR